VRDAAMLPGLLVLLQFAFGVSALVSQMIDLGVIHQMNAVLLLGALLRLLHKLRGATA
jgi:cytochrome c oxidase assembly protein subunit 15